MKIRNIFQSRDINRVCRSAFNIMGVNALPRELAREVASNFAKSVIRSSDKAGVSGAINREMSAIESEMDLAVANQCF